MSKHREAVEAAETAEAAPPAAPVTGWRLKTVVFVCGAVLMGLEMLSSRVLAIHFGNTIFVWGAIISVFLAALSGGYLLGGKIADAKPSFFVLNAIVFASGCWMLLIPFYAHPLCRGLVDTGTRTGPLLATTLIFAGPSLLLGVVSPFAVRLAAQAVEKIGNVAGQLYALSTIGSIAGTVVTAFWLIPSIPVPLVTQILGALLVALPFVVLPKSRALFIFLVPLAALGPGAFMMEKPPVVEMRSGFRLLAEKDSPYHYVLVTEVDGWGRFLQFNNYTESGIKLNDNGAHGTLTPYTDGFQLAKIFRPALKRILVIGGGGGIGPRKFVKDDENCEVDLVEIDPVVIDFSRKYFYLDEAEKTGRLHIHNKDGRRFVREADHKYDLVVLDAYTIGGQIPFHLTTKEFMEDIKRVLVPGGVLLANVIGSMEGKKSLILRSEQKTFSAVFDEVHVFPRPLDATERGSKSPLDPNRGRNVMLVAINGTPGWTPKSIEDKAKEFVALHDAPTETFLEDAQLVLPALLRTDDLKVLTDDYAPVDTMVF